MLPLDVTFATRRHIVRLWCN